MYCVNIFQPNRKLIGDFLHTVINSNIIYSLKKFQKIVKFLKIRSYSRFIYCYFLDSEKYDVTDVIFIFQNLADDFFLCTADVDVPDPDEKSLITYVSSLYDVFPEVPTVEQSVINNVRPLLIG